MFYVYRTISLKFNFYSLCKLLGACYYYYDCKQILLENYGKLEFINASVNIPYYAIIRITLFKIFYSNLATRPAVLSFVEPDVMNCVIIDLHCVIIELL